MMTARISNRSAPLSARLQLSQKPRGKLKKGPRCSCVSKRGNQTKKKKKKVNKVYKAILTGNTSDS